MGSFGIGINTKNIDSVEVKGKIYHVACKVWFTSTCSLRPLSLKFEGDDGIIQGITNINIMSVEDKKYSGIPSKEYQCTAIIGGLLHEFKLIFYIDDCKWIMVI